MSIIVIVDTYQQKIKKSAGELITYGLSMAKQLNTTLTTVCINAQNTDILTEYGAENILTIQSEDLAHFVEKNYAEAILQKAPGTIYILAHSTMGTGIGAYIAAKENANIISNCRDLPTQYSPIQIQRNAFSSKAFMTIASQAEKTVITVAPNSIPAVLQKVEKNITTETFNTSSKNLIVEEITSQSNKINLKEADIVISAGRGLKGPENWGMIEELANELGAATACSKPVSDIGWRPHTEHVGQTGITISPNLYIAIGISGAIQHLAGVNSSKKILAINNDPEAPFFKAADYGICADAFEVVPKLIEEIKAAKQ